MDPMIYEANTATDKLDSKDLKDKGDDAGWSSNSEERFLHWTALHPKPDISKNKKEGLLCDTEEKIHLHNGQSHLGQEMKKR